MRATLSYLLISLSLGLITVWGSENFFWSAPPADLTVPGWLLTWMVYALASGTAVSAVILTRAQGWLGLYLAAVLFGFLIEGVVVDTMYDAFPFQMVWTPMAWHGLITGLCVLGLGRVAPHWPLHRHLLALVGLGLFGAVFASFWPTERGEMPGTGAVAFYLVGLGLVVPLAHAVLDRVAVLPAPPRAVLWALPVLACLVWLVKSWYLPSPYRLAFLPVVGATLWAMHRLGGPQMLGFAPAVPVWRHLLFPLAPLVTTLVAVPMWRAGITITGELIAVVLTGPLSVVLWLWALSRAARA